MSDSLPHTRGPRRHPDEAVFPGRQESAVEVWVVGGGREKVAGNLKWPSFTIVQLLQWMSSLQDCSPFEWEWRANERWWNSHFKPMNHPIQSFYTHVNDWISADRGGANENLQGEVYLVFLRRAAELETFCFHPSASATRMESSAHLKCHYCVLSSNAATWKQWLSSTWRSAFFKEIGAFPRLLHYKMLPCCAININYYC